MARPKKVSWARVTFMEDSHFGEESSKTLISHRHSRHVASVYTRLRPGLTTCELWLDK